MALTSGIEMDEMARRYAVPLARYFRARVRTAADIDDMVQEVFLRLAARRGGGTLETAENYLFTVAASVLSDNFRRAARRGGTHQLFDELQHAEEDFSPERVYLGQERLRVVEAALYELPERTRVVFVLHRFEEMSYAQIARRLKVSVSAVEKHMSKALGHLSRRGRGL
ncbi:MAG TPA: sigma-70 family RNA polymerase sigma factor [Phenylobacterium sp.]|nr:sigma-70 family RNA polymerase sigma factor [Phenylobacterium sp.]